MANEWILDVLADLKRFAQRNGLTELAEQLDDTSIVAANELVVRSAQLAGTNKTNAAQTGGVSRAY